MHTRVLNATNTTAIVENFRSCKEPVTDWDLLDLKVDGLFKLNAKLLLNFRGTPLLCHIQYTLYPCPWFTVLLSL